MGFGNGSWAKIWSVERGDKSTKVRLSTSRKNKDTDEYEQDFSGFVTLAGTAHKQAANLKEGDRIQIGNCTVTSRYDKEKNKEYINFTMFSYEAGDDKSAPAKSESKAVVATDNSSEDELPF